MRAIAIFFIWFFVASPSLAMSLDVARDQLAGCFADVAAQAPEPSLNWAYLIEQCPQTVLNHSIACMANGKSKEDCGAQNIKMALDAIAKARLIRASRGGLR
jgi:ligand-binding SRPBCC domain-containing protein